MKPCTNFLSLAYLEKCLNTQLGRVENHARREQLLRGGRRGKMARKLSKNLKKARALVEPRSYLLVDAVPLLQKAKYAKFDAPVDLTMRLGVDPKPPAQ